MGYVCMLTGPYNKAGPRALTLHARGGPLGKAQLERQNIELPNEPGLTQ